MIVKEGEQVTWKAIAGSRSLLDSLLSSDNIELVKYKPHRQVFRVEVGSDAYYVKRFTPIKLHHKVKTQLIRSKAACEYSVAQRMKSAGQPCLSPVAYGLTRSNYGYVSGSVFVTSELLKFHSARIIYQETDLLGRLALVAAIGKQLAELHLLGFFIRDMHIDNLLVVKCESEFKVYYIDHEETRWFSGFFSYWRERNLRALVLPRYSIDFTDQEREVLVNSYRSHIKLGGKSKEVRACVFENTDHVTDIVR